MKFAGFRRACLPYLGGFLSSGKTARSQLAPVVAVEVRIHSISLRKNPGRLLVI
jgi:hypothetical protein